jgi:hypothetical protein
MNIHERNHQVTQMGMVYNLASRVIVWLGPSDENSLLAFRTLMKPGDWTAFFTPSADPSTVMEGNKKLRAIYSLLTREYWTRLWIIQEFLVARDFFIQCCNDKCTRMRISWFMSWIENVEITRSKLPQLDSILEKATIIRQIRISTAGWLLHGRYRSPSRTKPQDIVLNMIQILRKNFRKNFGTIRCRLVSSNLFRLYLDYPLGRRLIRSLRDW